MPPFPFVDSQNQPHHIALTNLQRRPSTQASTRALLQIMKPPYSVDDHDLQIEDYFRDVSSLLRVSADEDFKALHVETTPYVRLDETTVALSRVEVYLEGGKLVNIGADGRARSPHSRSSQTYEPRTGLLTSTTEGREWA